MLVNTLILVVPEAGLRKMVSQVSYLLITKRKNLTFFAIFHNFMLKHHFQYVRITEK